MSTRDWLRLIANTKRTREYIQNTEEVGDRTYMIGDRDYYTGKHRIIYPDGGSSFSGDKIFNRSHFFGEQVRHTLPFGSTIAALDSITPFYTTPVIPAEVIVEEVVPELAKTYLIFVIDSSGSFVDGYFAIRDAVFALKELLAEAVYDGDVDQANHYIRVVIDDSERWLYWLSIDPRTADALAVADIEAGDMDEASRYAFDTTTYDQLVQSQGIPEDEVEANKAIIFAFLNESDDNYHSLPRGAIAEPTAQFTADYQLFLQTVAARESFNAHVFSVADINRTIVRFASEFEAHLVNAFAQTQLEELGCSYTTELDPSEEPEYYLGIIKNLLGLS